MLSVSSDSIKSSPLGTGDSLYHAKVLCHLSVKLIDVHFPTTVQSPRSQSCPQSAVKSDRSPSISIRSQPTLNPILVDLNPIANRSLSNSVVQSQSNRNSIRSRFKSVQFSPITIRSQSDLITSDRGSISTYWSVGRAVRRVVIWLVVRRLYVGCILIAR